jgi:putative Mg2+ transporter-C (MgtC) family protein
VLEPLTIWELLLRAGLAVLGGTAIGWDRERRDKAAGIRTIALVALGSAGVVLCAVELNASLPAQAQLAYDPLRVVSGVIGGIGFLGAGAILHARGRIHGMTTAATIWAAAGFGIACGLGLYRLAGVLLGMTLVTLIVLKALKGSMLPEHDLKPHGGHHEGDPQPPGSKPE